MQLKTNKCIRQTLTAVTAAVLGLTPSGFAGTNHSETSLLIYSERDRVRATEGMFSVTKQLENGYRLDFGLTYDGLTGASPTGGCPSKYPQTLTSASGGGRVVVKAGELPIDKSFSETRFALDANVALKVSLSTDISGGVHLSSEHDYKSIGLRASTTRSLSGNKTSLGFAASAMRDVSSPIGGIPTAFGSTAEDVEREDGRIVGNGDGRKSIYDATLSISRVLGSEMLLRLSYGLNLSRGYLTDPYKIISIVQPPDSTDPGEPVEAIYESRPDSRTANSATCELRAFMLGLATETTYRFFWDDWRIRSHTADFALKIGLNRIGEIEPHIRWYRQGRADFSKPFLIQGEPLPRYASADSRLAGFDALNPGLAYTVAASSHSKLTLAADWYTQRGNKSPPESFGPLLAFNLFPDLDAFMLRVGMAHDF